MPRVSVIVPVHDPGPHLRAALESVRSQTFTDWEVVVVDDASSEDLGWIAGDFPEVRLFRQAHGGASVARNLGVLSSSGDLIAFMDQDDVWLPEKLLHQVSAMDESPEAGLCYVRLQVFSGDADAVVHDASVDPEPRLVIDPAVVEPDRSMLHRSMQHFSTSFVVPSTVMVRRSCLAVSGLLDPFLPFTGDYDLLIKLGARYGVLEVPSVDVLYRKHDNNFSDRYDVGRREVDALIGRYVAAARSASDGRLASAAPKLLRRPRSLYAAQAFDCARRSLRRRDLRATVRHLRAALVLDPRVVGRGAMSFVNKRSGPRA